MDTRYDEALERARAGMPIDEVFPELKESEDEKIRKELIEQVAHIVPDSTEFDDNGEVLSDYFKRIEKYRAYLERQKESLHISETCKENADSFTDEKIRKWLIEEIKATHDYDSPTSRKCVDDAIAYLERQKEHKPAEWSKEDELMRHRCIADLGYLTEYEPQYKERYDAQIEWLKSLKNRVISPESNTNSNWKPSKKQVRTLEQWLHNKQYDDDSRYVYPIFESIYNGLRKLL